MREDDSLAEYPHCPVCDQECSYVYKNVFGDIVGCDECLKEYDAWGEDRCFNQYIP